MGCGGSSTKVVVITGGGPKPPADLRTPVLDILTAEHLAFFHKYGFCIVRGLHNEEQIQTAVECAADLIKDAMTVLDDGKGEQAFGSLPEGSRSTWGRCTEPRLTQLFTFKENESLVSSVIGDFEFKHHPGPGFYTFAVRFHNWSSHPKVVEAKECKTTAPYCLENLPDDLDDFTWEFLHKADSIGAKFAPSKDNNWHLDGWDYKSVMMMNMLWGTYINELPAGDMGNLQVYPGSHHVLAHHLKTKGADWMYDGKKQTAPPMEKWPKLMRDNLCTGKALSLCVEAGDIVLAHPWLAHGIGCNRSDQVRRATYARLTSKRMFWPPKDCCRVKIAGQSLGDKPWVNQFGPKKWKGDMWAGFPGIRNWLDSNGNVIDAYDNGKLSAALKKLK